MRGPMRTRVASSTCSRCSASPASGCWSGTSRRPATDILTGSRFDPWLFRGGFLLTGVATLLVIAAVTHQRALTGRLLGNPLFNWIGTRSYGMYLYHWPIYQIIRKQAGVPLTLRQFLLAMVITLPITEASYRFVEMPIRQGALGEWLRGERRPRTAVGLRRRRRRRRWVSPARCCVGFAGVSIAMAPNLASVRSSATARRPGDDRHDRLPSQTRSPKPRRRHGRSPVPSTRRRRPSATAATTAAPPPTAPTTTVPIDHAVLRDRRVGDARRQAAAGGRRLQDGRRGVEGPDWADWSSCSWPGALRITQDVVIQPGTNGSVSRDDDTTCRARQARISSWSSS